MDHDIFTTKEMEDILQVVGHIYRTIICVDLTDGSCHYLQDDDLAIRNVLENRNPKMDERIGRLDSCGFVYADDTAEFVRFFNIDNIRKKLDSGRKYI